MTSYLLLQTTMAGGNPMFIASSSSAAGNQAALANWCSTNNVAIMDWAYRVKPTAYGTCMSSQMDDGINYLMYQVYGLADWEGDPADNYWVNDISKVTWLQINAPSSWEAV